MPTVTISERDRKQAELYLETFLTQARPDGDFSRGSYLRDLVISSMAYTVAHLRAEAKLALDRSSVKRVKAMAPGTDRDEAADDAMSNWFMSRKSGRPSRGVILLHLSQKDDLTIPGNTRFYYSPALSYVPDTDGETIVIPSSSIVEVSGAGGTVSRYAVLAVVATEPGADYDVDPAVWVNWDRFNPYVTRVESVQPFVGGKSEESTDDFLARADDAVSSRDLMTDRGIRAVLKDKFTTVDDVVVVGAGDQEMKRDVVNASGLVKMHSGGAYDAYIKGPVVTAPVFEGVVGGTFADPRPVTTSLLTNASLMGVTTGMVLKLKNPAAGESDTYLVDSVYGGMVLVSPRTPFAGPRDGAQFSIGTIYPNFDDVVPTSTGNLSGNISVSRAVVLPAEVPLYRVKAVTYLSGQTWVPLTRVLWSALYGIGVMQSYAISQLDPTAALSAYQLPICGVSNDVFDGTTLRVEYETVSGFDTVHTYMVDPRNRIVCANGLARALIPAYVKLTVNVDTLSGVTPPTQTDVQQAVLDYLENLPVEDGLRPRLLNAHLLQTFAGKVASINIPWKPASSWIDLQAPTGDVVRYVMKYDADKDDALVVLSKEWESTYPATTLLPDPLAYGISERTVRFVSALDLITVTFDA